MDAITDTLFSTAISTVLSSKNLDQYLQTNNLSIDTITEFTIPDDITEIGKGAFDGCTSLTSINIPNDVEEIGGGSFQGCTSLTSINIPNRVTKIGVCFFSGCTSLTEITIPDSVTKISNKAFQCCSSLTSITIPGSVTQIGERAFRGCSSLENITIPNGVTNIDEAAFADCRSLKSITIPDGVTEIGKYAFSSCSNLTSIIIPASVTKIGEGAFQRCTSLTSINIPDGVTNIRSWAFEECSSLAVIICNNPDQFNRRNIGIDTTQLQIISYQEHLTNDHADLLAAMNLTGLNNNEAYLINRMISGPEFNPSWEVLETTFNERSFEQIRKLLISLDKTIDHLPQKIISFRRCNITHPLSPFLTIAERNSLFGQAKININIRAPKKAQESPAAQQQTDEAPAAHH